MRPATETARFWARTHEEDRGYMSLCRIWDGGKTQKGYGKFRLAVPDRRSVQAHRYAFADRYGEEYLHSTVLNRTHEVDHLCRQIDCVRPEHLEYVTVAVNRQRMHDALRTEMCKNGTHFRENLEKIDSLGRRFCGGCALEADRRRRPNRRK